MVPRTFLALQTSLLLVSPPRWCVVSPPRFCVVPVQAEEVLQSATGQVQLPKDVGQTLGGVSAALSEFGKTLLMGTRELIDEVGTLLKQRRRVALGGTGSGDGSGGPLSPQISEL